MMEQQELFRWPICDRQGCNKSILRHYIFGLGAFCDERKQVKGTFSSIQVEEARLAAGMDSSMLMAYKASRERRGRG